MKTLLMARVCSGIGYEWGVLRPTYLHGSYREPWHYRRKPNQLGDPSSVPRSTHGSAVPSLFH